MPLCSLNPPGIHKLLDEHLLLHVPFFMPVEPLDSGHGEPLSRLDSNPGQGFAIIRGFEQTPLG